MFSDKVTMKKVLPSPPLGGTEVFDAVDDTDDTLDDDGDDDIDDDEVSLANNIIVFITCFTFTVHLTICFVPICLENLKTPLRLYVAQKILQKCHLLLHINICYI